MSDQFYEDDDDDFDEVDEKPQRSDSEWAELRRARKAKEKAEKELADMRKQMEFQKAGIDPSDPKAQYFVKGYDGEVSAEAIREEAIKAGFLSTEPEQQPDLSGVEAQDRISQAAGTGIDQPDLAMAALDQAFAEGGTEGMVNYLRSQGVPINETQ